MNRIARVRSSFSSPPRALVAVSIALAIACRVGVAAASDTPPASTAVNPQIAEKLLLANGYLENNRLDDAMSVVDELVRVRKNKPVDRAQIHRFRGYILIAKGKSEDAGKEFEAALAENALDGASKQGMIYSLAQIHTQAGRYDRARALIDQWFAGAEDPKPEAYFLEAMILMQQQAYADALEPARIAVERSPQPRESWLQLLAAIQFQLQDYKSVAGTLEQLVALQPANKRYWVQLATIESTIGNDGDAVAELGVAQVGGLLADDRDLRQRARQCFVHDLPTCCSETLEKGFADGKIKKDAESWQLLANCYIAARDTDKALEPLAKAGELAADNRSYLMLGQLELQKDRFDAAHDALVKAKAKSKPDQAGSIELLIGIASLGSNRLDDAEKSFRIARADDKTSKAADSYLKHLDQVRAIQQMKESAVADTMARSQPVSDAKPASSDRSL
ncbi:MAG TPA: tetratricopeptide repeat protein [Candidatus Binatia bacterium]|jgi:tetratricopeptide (TPR) repeat protein